MYDISYFVFDNNNILSVIEVLRHGGGGGGYVWTQYTVPRREKDPRVMGRGLVG